MFRLATPLNTPRAKPLTGQITPLAIPYKGLDARSSFSVMSAEYAITLSNVVVEPYGLRTRKGYTEWARNLDGDGGVLTLMVYYPKDGSIAASPTPSAGAPLLNLAYAQLFMPAVTPVVSAPIQLFAAKDSEIFDVSGGGVGPWTPEAVITGTSALWTWINFQNVAGSFLLVTNDNGGYGYYNGTSWAMPTMGPGAGQIDGVNPADFVYVMEWKRRVWFVEKESTSGWYLDAEAIVGAATEFDFGVEFHHGGYLVALANWTVDSGSGIDDRLVAVGSQGDIAIYEGTDPDDPAKFRKIGTWYVGPLPSGRRCVSTSGGDVFILTQFGVMPVSRLQASAHLPVDQQSHISYRIDPLIARLMQLYAAYSGWQITPVAREELLLIQVPPQIQAPGGVFLAYKTTTQAWSVLKDTRYADIVPIDNQLFAGTYDGRVVAAFNGPLDNVLIAQPKIGSPIVCQVTPAYQPLTGAGYNKSVHMIRPTFLTVKTPSLTFQILVDYGSPATPSIPTLTGIINSFWDEDLWDEGVWSGLQNTLKEWYGAKGVGFAVTAQLDYACGGDTLLMSLDFWTEQGGVL